MPAIKKQSKLSNFFAAPAGANGADAVSDVEMVGSGSEEDSSMKKAPAKKKARAKPVKMTLEEDDDDDDAPGPSGKKERYTPPEESSLPPLSALSDIFSDIVQRIPDIKTVAERVRGRKLRVATMCSGTESPLLALRMISRAMEEKYGVAFDVEHVFSCEIVPFKQAYIERNFHPPLLFRDVCELGDQYAHTAYGSTALVPGNVDILIAGTSCVDYSNLNNEKKDIEAGGESGRTFLGMMNWVRKHRPPIIILENVCSAPWDAITKKFESIEYSAKSHRLDTKQYYIPHTRLRGYLMAVDRARSNIPDKWVKRMADMRREASVSLDAFLLESDDPRIHRAREKLVQESYNANDRKTGQTDWGRCESRHQRARLDEELGNKRPLTNWGEGNVTKLPDFAWSDWGKGQVERVWDLLDISLLRSAKQGIDPSFKSQVWNLSQNVDRSTGSNKVGISPCLTPSMIPYITNRGGPMVGLEALHFQGLPIDELLLTRETEDQEADLAGNAMSTTVVGTAMISALALAGDLLITGDSGETYEEKKGTEEELLIEEGAMAVDAPQVDVEGGISGFEQLHESPLDLSSTADISLADILHKAMHSVRLCLCEGRKDITASEVKRCVDCGMTTCVVCGGRPEHNFETIDVVAEPRLFPSDFARDLKRALPMRLAFSGINGELLDQLRSQVTGDVSEKRWSIWREAVLEAAGSELQFVELKRQALWSVTYESTNARLELELHPKRPVWLFYAKPSASLPANSDARKMLLLPAARMLCDGAIFAGHWNIALPTITAVNLTIEGVGKAVPAWESKLGLQGSNYRDRAVWDKLQISVADDDAHHFDRPITGIYTLLDKCGTANSALHKKDAQNDGPKQPPLFMVFDPSRCGKPEEDSFVFSDSIRRYEYGEARPIVATLDSAWRQSDKEGEQQVKCTIPQTYMRVDAVSVTPFADDKATFAAPLDDFVISASGDACKTANALLVAKIPLGDRAGPEWPRDKLKEVTPIEERAVFRSVSWLTERVKVVNGTFGEWHDVDAYDHASSCERCAPKAPSVKWHKDANKMLAVEDPAQAGEYERRLKRRPAPFVTQLKLDNQGVGNLLMGINFTSLMHRAAARLPSAGRSGPLKLSWKLNTDFMPLGKLAPAKFTLTSNRKDPQYKQPPHFRQYPLRPEQLRSLYWMVNQESVEAPPFVEEEISEAILEPLGWRAEGRAQRPVLVRGGVLADEVGYGKTAITLGLIDCTRSEIHQQVDKAAEMPGKIRSRATIAIVPPHLTRQWASETNKFISKSSGFKVVPIATAADMNSLKIEDVQEADLVIVASNLFKSQVYQENLEALAAGGSLPSSDGRYFNARLDSVLQSLREQVDRLRTEGSGAVMEAIHDGRKAAKRAEIAMRPSKRLRGIQKTTETKPASNAKPAKANGSVTNGKSASSSKPPSSSHRQVLDYVEIPPRSSQSNGVIDVASIDASDDEGRPRRQRATKPIVIESDSDEEVAPVKKRRLNKAGKASSSRSASPDFAPSDEDSEDEANEQEDASSDHDSDAPKANGKSRAKPKKAAPKPKPKSKKVKALPSSDDEESMDVDNATSASEGTGAGAKKRKRADAKPKVLRESKDPWRLTSAAKRDWTEMQCPPFEMFHFARVVIDEYTYLDGKVLSMISRLSSDRHWVLSGTSPTKDFAALKTIARFLDIHLGIDDGGEGKSVKKRIREQTAAEQFHSFREAHSLDWHAHRNNIGQAFLDRFVRQNVAEIDEIKWEEHVIKVNLPAAERAIYLELEHHLRSLEMTIKRGRKNESDREKRLAKSLGDSRTAEEALLKRCSHFELESNKENAMRACDFIVQEREKQLEDCKREFVQTLKAALKMEKDIGYSKGDPESLFRESVRVARDKGVGDDDAKEIILQLFEEAGVGPKVPSGSGKSMKDTVRKDLAWTLREKAHHVRRLIKELVGRRRSLRYFAVVRDLQKHREEPPTVDCPGCGRDKIPLEEIAVLSSCGHTGCYTCVLRSAENEECVYFGHGSGSGCEAPARVLNIVKGSTLGVDESNDRVGKRYGKKLEEVVNLIRDKSRVKKTERILIFVQFPDLMKKVGEALTARGIAFLEIKGSASAKSKNLEAFQNESKERVLLLNVMDESASGANLTGANHAIFLSPLLTDSQEEYDACETQAIGRLRRYGQTQTVHIWRFLTIDTMDVEQLERRKGIKVADLKSYEEEVAAKFKEVVQVESDVEMEE